MRLKPMYFGNANCIIRQTNLSNAFQFSPAAFPESSAQDGKNTNAASDGDCFNLSNLSDDFKVHRLNQDCRYNY